MGKVTGNITNTLSQLNPNQFNANPDLDRVWLNWMYDRIEETNNFYKSGIISQSQPIAQRLMQAGNGLSIAIPHVTAIDASLKPQKWNSNTTINGNADGHTYTEREIKMTQSQSYDVSDYDTYVSGVQSLNNIMAQFADYWGHVDEQQLLKTVHIAFLNQEIRAAKSYGLDNPKDLNVKDFTIALSRMGDNNLRTLTKIAMNSGVYEFLRSQDDIEYVQPSNGIPAFSTYNGFQVVIDDQIPFNDNGTSIMVIFGGGAVDYAVAPAPNSISTTRDENQNGGVTQITHKRIVVCHVDGTDVDYATAQAKGYNEQNWDDAIYNADAPVYKPVNSEDLRDIKVVEYGFKVPTDYRVPGVNAPNSNGTEAGDDGQISKKSSGSSNSSSNSSNKSSNSKSSKK